MRTEVLRMDNVTMCQWGITQMEHFNFQVYGGEIMGLMTVNSHGVEALLSLLQSNPPIHFGRVYYREELVNSHIYSKAAPNAIVVIEQRSHLVSGLTVADNVFVLSGAYRRWVVRGRSFKSRLQILEQTVGVEIPYDRLAEDLSFFERCMVELLKAAEAGVRLVVLRDMGHYLAGEDIDRLHRAARYFASCGMSFLYISNSYEELGRICDRMAVMYNGTVIHVADRASWERGRVAALLEKLTGAAAVPPKSAPTAGGIRFAMRGVRTAALRDIDLSVHSGECLVIRTEDKVLLDGLRRLASGETPLLSGQMLLDGRPVRKPLGRDGRIAYIAENPPESMLFPDMSYLRNLTFRVSGGTGAWWRRKALYHSLKSELAEQLGPVFDKRMDELTAREQYSLVFQRILLQRPRVLFCEQPFWGNDILLRQHVVEQLRRQLERGCSVVVLIVGMYDGFPLADRTMIYREGRLIGQSGCG